MIDLFQSTYNAGFCGYVIETNDISIRYDGSGVEGSQITALCQVGSAPCQVGSAPSQEMTSTCTSSGQWQPHPGSLECLGMYSTLKQLS